MNDPDSTEASAHVLDQKSSIPLIVLVCFGAGIVTLLLAAWYCNGLAERAKSEGSQSAIAVQEAKTISFCCHNPTDPFFQKVVLGGELEGERTPYELEWRFGSSLLFENSQAAVLHGYLRGEPIDALVITPLIDYEHIGSMFESLQQQLNIPIVTLDAVLKPETIKKHQLNVWEIQIDQAEAAAKAARHLAQNLAGSSAETEKCKVVILGGNKNQRHAHMRVQGAKDALAEFPHVELLDQTWASWSPTEAYDYMNALLAGGAEVDGVVCSNDRMAFGAIRALKEHQKSEVKVVGFDGLPEALEAIRAGDLLATVDQNPQKQGMLGVRVARRILDGEEVEKSIKVDVELIDQNSPQVKQLEPSES